MSADQDTPTYDGSDSQFVSSNGGVIQQGFATNEVYKYENEINWKDGAPADVSFFTVSDMGFDNYPAAITMLRSRATELDACLKLLVPKMQQAWIDFLKDPKPIMDTCYWRSPAFCQRPLPSPAQRKRLTRNEVV